MEKIWVQGLPDKVKNGSVECSVGHCIVNTAVTHFFISIRHTPLYLLRIGNRLKVETHSQERRCIVSTTSTYDDDEQDKIAQKSFQTLQANVVSLRNAVLIQRASAIFVFRRYKQTKILLAKNEVELKQLHELLHPDEQ